MPARKLPTLPHLAADAWLLLQQALAATLAWLIASRVMQHHIPFFAPIAAVVALNTSLGQRGTNAVRLLIGVAVGSFAARQASGSSVPVTPRLGSPRSWRCSWRSW